MWWILSELCLQQDILNHYDTNLWLMLCPLALTLKLKKHKISCFTLAFWFPGGCCTYKKVAKQNIQNKIKNWWGTLCWWFYDSLCSRASVDLCFLKIFSAATSVRRTVVNTYALACQCSRVTFYCLLLFPLHLVRQLFQSAGTEDFRVLYTCIFSVVFCTKKLKCPIDTTENHHF